jgi:hypothetical protein
MCSVGVYAASPIYELFQRALTNRIVIPHDTRSCNSNIRKAAVVVSRSLYIQTTALVVAGEE